MHTLDIEQRKRLELRDYELRLTFDTQVKIALRK